MCSHADRIRAVELYIKLGKRMKATIRQLGCQSASKIHPLSASNFGSDAHLVQFSHDAPIRRA